MGGRFSRARAERRAARVHARDLMADEGAQGVTLAWSEVDRRISITSPLVHGGDDGSENVFAEFGEERMGAEEGMHSVAGATALLGEADIDAEKSPDIVRSRVIFLLHNNLTCIFLFSLDLLLLPPPLISTGAHIRSAALFSNG
jgi:hypothetical protein